LLTDADLYDENGPAAGDATWIKPDALIARAGVQVVAQDTELMEAARGLSWAMAKARIRLA